MLLLQQYHPPDLVEDNLREFETSQTPAVSKENEDSNLTNCAALLQVLILDSNPIFLFEKGLERQHLTDGECCVLFPPVTYSRPKTHHEP